jgi:hypothetical protein
MNEGLTLLIAISSCSDGWASDPRPDSKYSLVGFYDKPRSASRLSELQIKNNSCQTLGPASKSFENKWRHFTDDKSCQIIESILKYSRMALKAILCTKEYLTSHSLKIPKIVFTFDVFLSTETTMHCKVTCILYKKQAHFSQLFCLQVDQWPHDSYIL